MIRLPFARKPRPGDILRGDLCIPDGPPPRSAVVMAHGFKGFKEWGFFPWVAKELAAAGYAVVRFNFSRNGIAGDPDRFTDLERFARNTLTLEQEELRLVLSEVLDGDLLPRRPRRAALLGHGRGGAHAILAAAAEPRVQALVTWAAMARFDRWSEETRAAWRAEGKIWVLNQQSGEQMAVGLGFLEDFEAHRRDLDVEAAAARVQAPWLIVHGTEDLSVWPRDAEILAAANSGTRLHRIVGAGHTFETAHPFREASPALCEAVAETLRHLGRHMEP